MIALFLVNCDHKMAVFQLFNYMLGRELLFRFFGEMEDGFSYSFGWSMETLLQFISLVVRRCGIGLLNFSELGSGMTGFWSISHLRVGVLKITVLKK